VPVTKFNDIISSQVACLLKEEREKRGVSLNFLAQKAGVSRLTVSNVEQEDQNPKPDTFLRITSVLDVDLEKISPKSVKGSSGVSPECRLVKGHSGRTPCRFIG
jgi:transcriptional regulator with XRE-family HTH domain